MERARGEELEYIGQIMTDVKSENEVEMKRLVENGVDWSVATYQSLYW
jgi:hypothetical protein